MTSSPAPTPSTRSDPLDELNAAQRDAVEHGIADGNHVPLLVIAGAGSGKTNTLAHRVVHLIRNGADPQRMLLLTFSRRAAIEMERRVGTVLQRALGMRSGYAPPSLPWAGTFHGIGARLLRDCAPRIGLSETFTILDRGDAEDMLGMLRHELGFTQAKSRFPLKGTCLSVYSRAVNSQSPLSEVLKSSFPWCAQWEDQLKQLFRGYVLAKQDQHVLDYDDLLLYWSEMMSDPDIARDVGNRFDYVLVDEYQDTNILQANVLLAMKPTGQGVTVVGDDAQSIYSFRAATVRNILDFPTHFSQPARVITLDRNYRSTQSILDASNAVIGLARERFAKNLWTDRASTLRPALVTVSDDAGQARWVADQVLANREAGATLKSQAALFRTSSHSAALELELTRRNIPFVKFGGLKFLEAAHIKDVLAVLRFAHNPQSRVAGFRVVQLIPGVGPATAGKLMDMLMGARESSQVVSDFKPTGASEQDWSAFATCYSQLRAPGIGWPADLDLTMGWYGAQLERLYDDHAVRRGDLDQLARIAAGYGTRERFLTELTLDPPDATSDESGVPLRDEDYMILSTIHSSKGQEWKAVYVLNVVDGCIPSDMATGTSDEIEEERRLLYVAMTRAKEQLQLVVPQRFYVHQQSAMGDRHVYGSRTRFIPDSMLGQFELLPKPPALGALPPADPSIVEKRIDIASRIRSIWQ